MAKHTQTIRRQIGDGKLKLALKGIKDLQYTFKTFSLQITSFLQLRLLGEIAY